MKKDDRQQLLRSREAANHRFAEITPAAVNMIWDMAQDPDINAAARVQLLTLIVNRGLGKQEETVKLISEQEKNETARAELEEAFARFEAGNKKPLKKTDTQRAQRRAKQHDGDDQDVQH